METFDNIKASNSGEILHGYPMQYESESTTHYSIVDSEGNAVSVTTTLNRAFGTKIVVAGSGFLLNNEMDDFSAKPGVPNSFGLIGNDANAVVGGKRMLSSMTPTIIEKDNKLFMVVGSPGGSKIITSVYQAIVNVIDHGLGMQEAVSNPRIHHQWMPDLIYMEPNSIESQIKDELTKMGHTLKERTVFGEVDAILVLPDGKYEGGADPRGDDFADGF